MEILPIIPYLFVISFIIFLNIYLGGTRVSFLIIILKFTDSPLLSNKAPSLSLSKVDSQPLRFVSTSLTFLQVLPRES